MQSQYLFEVFIESVDLQKWFREHEDIKEDVDFSIFKESLVSEFIVFLDLMKMYIGVVFT